MDINIIVEPLLKKIIYRENSSDGDGVVGAVGIFDVDYYFRYGEYLSQRYTFVMEVNLKHCIDDISTYGFVGFLHVLEDKNVSALSHYIGCDFVASVENYLKQMYHFSIQLERTS